MGRKDMGASLSGQATAAETTGSALRDGVPSAGDECEYGCDGYGPFGACSTCTGIIERDDGGLVDLHGDELTGIQIYEQARRLALRDAARIAWLTEPLPDFPVSRQDLSPFNYGKDCAYANIRLLEVRDAQAIEARQRQDAETGLARKGESAGRQASPEPPTAIQMETVMPEIEDLKTWAEMRDDPPEIEACGERWKAVAAAIGCQVLGFNDDFHASFTTPDGIPIEVGPKFRTTITTLQARLEEAERLVYIPGVWRCAKCNFRLVQSNLNAHDGAVTARDDPGEKCPNDGSPLWRVAYKDDVAEAYERWEEQVARAVSAESRLEEAERVIALGLELFDTAHQVWQADRYLWCAKARDFTSIRTDTTGEG